MTDHRTARLNEQLKREISHILVTKVRDPRIGRVMVTEARVTTDLSVAKIFFRPLEGNSGVEETLAGLETAAPFVRRELGKVLHIRRVPELRFIHDTTMDSAQRIEEILREVLPDEEEAEEASVEDESEGYDGGENP